MDTFVNVMDNVYGSVNASDVSSWKPKAYEENKGRYLWTDAFGVCNYLSLFRCTGTHVYLEQAERLVLDVHSKLGQDRSGSQRLGSSSVERPCLGGLRIGKPNNEGSGMSEDGQYFHYLTKWMFTLNRMFLCTDDHKYQLWAEDLASTACKAFVRNGRMYWKMSIDLSHPLVNSEGGLDPYDGLATFKIIKRYSKSSQALQDEISVMENLVSVRYLRYQTNDVLDAGEALWLASWFPEEPWAIQLKNKAHLAVNRLWDIGEFRDSACHRLAFREFGTTIGVQMHPDIFQEWDARVRSLHKFWENRICDRDRDITPVMYCTSLMPGVFLPDSLHS